MEVGPIYGRNRSRSYCIRDDLFVPYSSSVRSSVRPSVCLSLRLSLVPVHLVLPSTSVVHYSDRTRCRIHTSCRLFVCPSIASRPTWTACNAIGNTSISPSSRQEIIKKSPRKSLEGKKKERQKLKDCRRQSVSFSSTASQW